MSIKLDPSPGGRNALLGSVRALGRGAGGAFSVVAGRLDDGGPGAAEALGEAEAEVLESGPALAARDVGAGGTSRFDCFLDGVQRAGVVLRRGPVPVVYAWGAAAVRERHDRRLRTLGQPAGEPFRVEQEALFFPFQYLEPDALVAAGLDRGVMRDTGAGAASLPLFPPLLYARARAAVNRWRETLERSLAERWCRTAGGEHWLLVDGSVTLSAELAAHARAVGMIKSHRTRFFDGDDARLLLGLERGQRTSVFRPGTRRFTPVASWYLRLRSTAGRDPLWGLIRVETAPDAWSTERADAISRWLLDEAAPASLPDPRWDRLLYPIHDCEMHLRARAPKL